METKITYSKNKIEMVGELDPDAEVSNIRLANIDQNIHLQLTTTIPVSSKDLEELFIWLNSNRVGYWEGEWRLTLEKISTSQLESECVTSGNLCESCGKEVVQVIPIKTKISIKNYYATIVQKKNLILHYNGDQ